MKDHHLQQQQEMSGLDLPPGFRFHPTDEEIITFYLTPKVLDRGFCSTAIGEVDLNKSEPWDLPSKAKMGEKEWYFYCQKDRKYPTGMRTNRATEGGYWKATGKDKEIYRPGRQVLLVGMKKTLVFYKGRAPRGEKTNWVMHEYRLEGRLHLHYPTNSTASTVNNASSSKDEWVVCRIFHKSSGIKKVPSYHVAMIGGSVDQTSIPMPMAMIDQQGFPLDSSATCTLPPLIMDPSSLYATAAGVNTSSVAPPASSSSYLAAGSSLAGVGNAALQMNGQYLGNPMAAAQAQPMFYQQMGAAGGFMTGPASGPSSMVSQDTGLSNEQNNAAAAAEISSVNMGMDAMWKY